MKKKTFSKITILGLTSSLLIPGSVAFGENPSIQANSEVKYEQTDEVKELKPSIEVTDKDGNLIKSYSEEEINEMMQEEPMFPNYKVLAEEEAKRQESMGNPSTFSFDENGTLISSSETYLVEQQKETLKQMAASPYGVAYSFDKTIISNSVWIGQGRLFYKPLSVHVIPQGTVSLSVQVYDSSTSYVGEVTARNFSGGLNIAISHLATSGNYKLKLQNRGIYDLTLTGGQVYN